MLPSLALTLALAFAPQNHAVRASPFDGLRWDGDRPEVLVEQTWYRPRAIDGLGLDAIRGAIDERWPGMWRKRFGEDLVEAMTLLGWEGDLWVDLDLVRLDDDEAVRLEAVAMTLEKRDAIRDGARRAETRPRAVLEIDAEAARADLEAFRSGLERRFAYLGLRDVDLDAELAAIEAELGAGPVRTVELARALHRLLVRCGDGHASVRAPGAIGRYAGRYLPFLLSPTSAGVVACRADRRELLDPDRLLPVAIDGRPLEDWLALARRDGVAGSPQVVELRALRRLLELDDLRDELGVPIKPTVEVTLTDGAGGEPRTLELPMLDDHPDLDDWPRGRSRILEGRIGYLRIARMDSDVDAVRASMEEFAKTDGLIVDVRGNGGGSREILLALAGYLIGPDEPPVVANVAAYRDGGDFEPGHLEARFMHPADWDGWTEPRRTVIRDLATTFEPEWRSERPMSPWHYLVLDRTGREGEYWYDRPVVVLSDEWCFSATDIFLGGLELLPRVTLLGTASGGGSARSQRFELPHSKLVVTCASMASYRPDGRLYDGRGIEVDIEVERAPRDLLLDGGDRQLDAALARLDAHD